MRMPMVCFLGAVVIWGSTLIRLDKLPKVGDEFKVRADSVGLCMVRPGQMDSCSMVEVNGVQYAVAYRKKSRSKGPVVTYLHTTDPKFVSPDGKRVGDSMEIDYLKVVPAPGFEIYAGDPVGQWTAVVGFSGEVTLSSGDSVPIATLASETRPLHLRVIGFTAR